MLTGKYSVQNPPPGARGRLYMRRSWPRSSRSTRRSKEIGEAHGGKTPAQVALNWLICKGAVPIPGAKNARQAEQNAGALGWRLTEEEVEAAGRRDQRVLDVTHWGLRSASLWPS